MKFEVKQIFLVTHFMPSCQIPLIRKFSPLHCVLEVITNIFMETNLSNNKMKTMYANKM